MKTNTGVVGNNSHPIMDIVKSISRLFTTQYDALPLQYVRVTEKFDVVTRPHYKGWVLKSDNV